MAEKYGELAKGLTPYIKKMVRDIYGDRNTSADFPVSASMANSILLITDDGIAANSFEADSTGFSVALAQADSGDVVLVPATTISGNHTVGSGIEVVGLGAENTDFSGTITNNGILTSLKVSGTLSNNNSLRLVFDGSELHLTDSLHIHQTADSEGLQISGYDDKSGNELKAYVNASGESEFVGDANTLFRSTSGWVALRSADNNIYLDMGDASGAQKVSFRDSAFSEVASLDSDGNLSIDGDLTISSLDLTGYIDIPEIADPGAPAADTVRLYAIDQQGFPEIRFQNSTSTTPVNQQVYEIVRNVTGGQLDKGTVVYLSGETGSVSEVAKAKADSNTTMPAAGVLQDDIADNGYGRMAVLGIVEGFDTSAFSAGDELYVSATTAGEFTATAPSIPNIEQQVGHVHVSGVGNGKVQVTIHDQWYSGQLQTGELDISGITDGNIPYMSASGFADSPLSTDGDNVALGTTNYDGSVSDALVIYGDNNGPGASATPPASSSTFYSKSDGSVGDETWEMWVADSKDNQTQLSPHNEKGEWIFYSHNPTTGKTLKVEMEKLVKFIDSKFGTDFVKEE